MHRRFTDRSSWRQVPAWGVSAACLAASIALLVPGVGAAQATDGAASPDGLAVKVEVRISGFPDDRGNARISLANEKVQFKGDEPAFREKQVKIEGGKANHDFRGVPPGDYAIRVFHDQDADGKLDTNFIGIPKEHYGYSNNPRPKYGPAGYDEAKFVVEAEPVVVEIEMMPPPF